jgi:hypothetical protein
MEPAFGHPLWISSGILLMFAGFLLFRRARRNDASGRIASATREAAVNKLFKGGNGQDATMQASSQKLATHHFRRAISQLSGITGFLLIIAGLMAVLLGIFYAGG